MPAGAVVFLLSWLPDSSVLAFLGGLSLGTLLLGPLVLGVTTRHLYLRYKHVGLA